MMSEVGAGAGMGRDQLLESLNHPVHLGAELDVLALQQGDELGVMALELGRADVLRGPVGAGSANLGRGGSMKARLQTNPKRWRQTEEDVDKRERLSQTRARLNR